MTYGLDPTAGQRHGTGNLVGRAALTSSFDSPHTAYSLTTSACVTCHRSHSATGPSIDLAPGESSLCLACHDAAGTGSVFPVASELQGIPANDPATGSWYSHPITQATGHRSDAIDEFGGVLNRHSTCSDCHDSHNATSTAPVESADGWSASGAIAGASSVEVTNRAGQAPTYRLVQGPTSIAQDGSLTGGTVAQFEYQLCFKCHSGYTVLPSNSSGAMASHPSWWTLDKGVELDPLNAVSFHPIEAQGTNQTAAMAASLSGTSPYKLWDLATTDTIRCTSCHAGPATPAAGTTPDAILPLHASPQRGILIAPYQDRVLKPAGEAYAASDFALCYLCHAEGPMSLAASTSASNFNGTPGSPFDATFQSLHALHLAGIADLSTGTAGDIDTPGAGQGNAICAECHFRLHSTKLAYDTGDRGNSRLVNFAPDVEAVSGQLSWTSLGEGQGSCTLTCHGYTHQSTTYGP